MRNHANLEKMIQKETSNPTPRAASRLLLEQAPENATDACLYKNRQGAWLVVFCGPGTALGLVPHAPKRLNGRSLAATCPLPRPSQ